MPEWWGRWPRYVPVAERRAKGQRHVAGLGKRGRALRPVAPRTRGRALAATFWGRAWCDNLASYASLANRLDRGRSYLRHGLVLDLAIAAGAVTALVSGSEVYEVEVGIRPMTRARWTAVVKGCAGRIDSVVELLAGRLDDSVMAHVCRQGTGLFPTPAEISMACTCPDGAGGGWLCKHVAAALYGVGVRLDEEPEMLFRLRGVDPGDLLARAAAGLAAGTPRARSGRRAVASERLTAVFGIDLDAAPAPRGAARRPPSRPRKGRA
jgi:uncharacterized Zn finger protein